MSKDDLATALKANKLSDQHGENNPNWKGGISKDHYRYKLQQKQRYPDRVAARDAVSAAISRGHLKREPCRMCGAADTEAHHDDYSKPLQVTWLCRRHHRELHAQAAG